MKKHVNSIIITVFLTIAFILYGCNSSINNPEKNKKQNTNTSTGSSSADVSDEPELELDSTELPLTLKVIEAGKIILSGRNSFERISIQKGNGLIFDPADIITVQAGDIIHFYGKNYKGNGSANLRIECTSDCYVYGNAMSLIYYTDFAGKTRINENYALQKLFLNNTHIKNHETLDIVLPATTLSEGCYKKMFYGCTGLTRSPELPAETLTKECYNYMFCNCKNLNSVKCLATDISAADCTKNWLANVYETGSFLCTQESNIWLCKDKHSGIPVGWVSDPPCARVDAKELPLTLEAIEDGKIIITTYIPPQTQNTTASPSISSGCKFLELKYSKNGEEPQAVNGDITVSAGDKICLYAKGPNSTANDFLNINSSGDCYIYGNIMSLIDPVDYKELTTIEKEYCFSNLFSPRSGSMMYGLFSGSSDTHLKNCAIELVLPATTLSNYCYFGMFNHCSGLTVASELPAETLKQYCYKAMYQDCDGLTIAPELPATTLSAYCYESMFQGCDGLTIAPQLPAKKLSGYCYMNMFCECSSLISAPELPATTLASSCYYQMFKGCTSLLNAPKELPAETLTSRCYFGMFQSCKSLSSAPEIKATTLADNCYQCMFMLCNELVSAPELPVKVLKDNCYQEMFSHCTKLKVAPVLQAEDLATNCYNNMFYNCPNIQIIKCLAKEGTTSSQGLFTHSTSQYFSNIDAQNGLLVCVDTSNFTDCPSGWKKVKESLLTLEVIQDGTIEISKIDSFNDMHWLINSTTFADISSEDTLSMCFDAGDTISLFASGPKSEGANNLQINCTSDCYIYGDLMSLDNYSATISQAGEFKGLFKDNTHIKNHPTKKIILSAQTLSDNCYQEMFYGCTGLTSAPELPAGTLASSCYDSMFYGCTGLISASALQAQTLSDYCYQKMFYGCTGLTSAPELLPAGTLANHCYDSMFYGCTGLTSAPALPAETLADYCYKEMFKGCTGLTSAPELPATTLDFACYSSMFYGCTGLTSAPELPATTLDSSCYSSMFYGCTGLTSAPELPATTLGWYCYSRMFDGCAKLTSAPELPATTLAKNCYEYMFQNCKSLETAPDLNASSLESDCYQYMFAGCTSLKYIKCLVRERLTGDTGSYLYTYNWLKDVPDGGTFVCSYKGNWGTNSASSIPNGWKVVETQNQ